MIHAAAPSLLAEFFPGVQSLSFLRLDLPDPLAGGNKSFKLKYHLAAYRAIGEGSMLSFGGAYSNHIAALAHAGKTHSIPTIGVIRGEELNARSNPVLQFAVGCGMKLHFIPRSMYRDKNEPHFIRMLSERFGAIHVVPEGGGGDQGVRGCREILMPECDAFDEIALPVGTGTTIAGLIQAAKAHQHISGIAVLAAKGHLEEEISKTGSEKTVCTWNLVHDFTLGGYADTSDALEEFIRTMQTRFDLPLDRVYSGKALFALHRMAIAGSFHGKNVLFVHTGGYAFEDGQRPAIPG